MDYNVTDRNVSTYLDELRQLICTIGTSSVTGTVNLKSITSFISDNIKDTTYRAKETLAFSLDRYSRVSTTLTSLEDTAQNEDNLDLRYAFHKSAQNSIKTFSSFMLLVNGHVDVDLSSYTTQMAEYRRELSCIQIEIYQLQQTIAYLEDFALQLPQLITMCST